MNRALEPAVIRRTLFDGALLQIGHVAVRPVSSEPGEVETSALNVLALPLTGVFSKHEASKHDAARRQVIATPNHALFISAGEPYRIGFPGCIGDRCLVLRFASDALARALPRAMSGGGFDAAAFAAHAPLPPTLMLARSRLYGRLARGPMDPLQAEELGIGLLAGALHAARTRPAKPARGRAELPGAARRVRQIERVKEAVWTQPEHPWTLGELADLACVSPWHLARMFRAEVGTSVYRYAMRSRLARALDSVLDSDAELTHIALDAGFASHSHFTARFRALFGHTPLELRRGIRDAKVRELRKAGTAQTKNATAREAVVA